MLSDEFWAKERHATITFGKPVFIFDLPEYIKDDSDRFRITAKAIIERIYALNQAQ